MTITISLGRVEDTPAAARLLAESMGGFGMAVLGLGDMQLELRAMQRWFGEKETRFSHQFAHLARLEGEIAGLVLGFPGVQLPRLTLGCARSIRSIYRFGPLLKLIWRGMILGGTKEAEKDEFLIAHIAVFESFRRKGIARRLLDRAILSARETGLSRVVLEVEIGNTAAIQLYEIYGFRQQFTPAFGRYKTLLNCPGFHKMILQL